MKYLKQSAIVVLVAAIMAISFTCGSLWTDGMNEAYADDRIVYVDKIVPVEVPLDREWAETMVLGLTPDGKVDDLSSAKSIDRSLYMYIFTIDYDPDVYGNEITVWVPYDDEGTWAGIPVRISASEYLVSVERGESGPGTVPEPKGKGEGDEF